MNRGKFQRAAQRLPIGIADERGRRGVELLLGRVEAAAEDGFNLQHMEKIMRNIRGGNGCGFSVYDNCLRGGIVFGDSPQRVTLRPYILEIRVGEGHPPAVVALLPQAHDLLGVLVWQWAKEHAINDAEDRGGRANAE